MCCFAGPVQSVTNTRIFASLSGTGTQFVAYQMRYKSEVPNAMILPIPAERGATEASIRFVDLSEYDRFFPDLNRGFPEISRPPLNSRARPTAAAENAIEVHEVGDFVASFVPMMKDFERLDPQFVIDQEVWAKIPEYADYSFVVFQLKNLAGEPHPMAFEFSTRMPNTVFFPTVHIHDGEVHDVEEFDHELYLQHVAYDKLASSTYSAKVDRATKCERSKFKASVFMNVEKAKGLIDPDLLVHRKKLVGRLNNRDTLLATEGDLTRGSAYFFNPKVLLPVAAALLPLGWIIHRRNRLSYQQRQTAR
ncbi:MAG: hypothetical protein R3C53_12105 [Pirellulaceae bacterium]